MLHHNFSNSSAIRQIGKSQKGCYKKTKHGNFSPKKIFLPPDMYEYISGGKKCSFFGKFGGLCFLATHLEIRPFACFITDKLRYSNY